MSCPERVDVRVVAHRGAWRAAGLPQNSLAALRRAIALGGAASECDVHLSADNVLLVAHDDDWHGMPIATTDTARLLGQPLPNGEGLPRLADFLAVLGECAAAGQGRGFKLLIELKSSPLGDERTLEAVGLLLGEVAAAGVRGQVEYILFHYDAARLLIATDPEAHVSYLGGDVAPAQLYAEGFAGLDYDYRLLREQPQWFAQAKELGLATNVWTVNGEADLRFALGCGISSITTDEPELLTRLLHANNDQTI